MGIPQHLLKAAITSSSPCPLRAWGGFRMELAGKGDEAGTALLVWPGENCHSLEVTPAPGCLCEDEGHPDFPFLPLGCFYPPGPDWLCSSGPDGSLALGFPGGERPRVGGSCPELLRCSHPQRNLPRQTRTRSDARAMQNSCQVNQGEQHNPGLPGSGSQLSLSLPLPPGPNTQEQRGEALVMGKLLGVVGAPSSLSPWKSQGFPSLVEFKEGED